MKGVGEVIPHTDLLPQCSAWYACATFRRNGHAWAKHVGREIDIIVLLPPLWPSKSTDPRGLCIFLLYLIYLTIRTGVENAVPRVL